MLNFALIGCGRIANRHSELLGNSHIKGAKLAAVVDLNYERAEKVGSKYNDSLF